MIALLNTAGLCSVFEKTSKVNEVNNLEKQAILRQHHEAATAIVRLEGWKPLRVDFDRQDRHIEGVDSLEQLFDEVISEAIEENFLLKNLNDAPLEASVSSVDSKARYIDSKGVFFNSYGICDAAILSQLEHRLTSLRIVSLLENPLVGQFDLDHLQRIHAALFSSLYTWAGKLRITPSSKRAPNGFVSVFAEPETIQDKWAKLRDKIEGFLQNTDSPFDDKLSALIDIFVDANHAHPFPEGNGRSLQVFMTQLAQAQGVYLNFSTVNPTEWNIASSLSGVYGRLFEHTHLIQYHPDRDPIRRIFYIIANDRASLKSDI